MPKYSGKLVNTARIQRSKNGVRSSTVNRQYIDQSAYLGAQPAIVPYFRSLFTQYFSPLKIAVSPLIEHYFYPVSTAPTISTIKGKFKER